MTKITHPDRLRDLIVVDIRHDGRAVIWQSEDFEDLIYKEQPNQEINSLEQLLDYKKDNCRSYTVYTKEEILKAASLPKCLTAYLEEVGAIEVAREEKGEE